MELYKANIMVSKELFVIIGMLEIALRNAIDTHYSQIFNGSPDWILQQSKPTGFLGQKGSEKSLEKAEISIRALGKRYTHDKLVAELSFGFWRYLFASKQYQFAGSSLLNIFPNRPKRTPQKDIFKKLGDINAIRNRIAHHEPICFGVENSISSKYAEEKYHEILELLQWMNYSTLELLQGIDNVEIKLKNLCAILDFDYPILLL